MLLQARVLAYLKATITGDATFMSLVYGAYPHKAPPGAVPVAPTKPWCVYDQHATADDVRTVNEGHVYTPAVYLAKVAAPSNLYPALVTAADRLDTVLAPTSYATSQDARLIAFYRIAEFEYVEDTGGVEYTHVGFLYQADAQPSSYT